MSEVSLTLRLPQDLYSALRAAAKAEDRPLASLIRRAAQEYLEGDSGTHVVSPRPPSDDPFGTYGSPTAAYYGTDKDHPETSAAVPRGVRAKRTGAPSARRPAPPAPEPQEVYSVPEGRPVNRRLIGEANPAVSPGRREVVTHFKG